MASLDLEALVPTERPCGYCGTDISAKRKDAKYCSRSCKTGASDDRRKVDGRSIARDRARYPVEAVTRRRSALCYYRDHQAECVENSRIYRRNNPHRRRVEGGVRGARMVNNPGYVPFTDAEWLHLVWRFDHRCAYCGVRADALQKDHVIPLSRGGRHALANILPACALCNGSKSTALLSEWRHARRGGVFTPWIL